MITRRAVTAGLATTLIGLPRPGRSQTSSGAETVLTAKPAPMKLRADAAGDADVWSFDGSLSPVVKARQGEQLRLVLRNETPLPLSLHFHGVRGPNAMDGVGGLTQEPVATGKATSTASPRPMPAPF